MALVDYSSSSSTSSHSDSEDNNAPVASPAKRRKASPHGSGARPEAPSPPSGRVSDLPPLPSAFHDLYASTVRQSVVDDPALHHGRKRLTPHVVGNWPSHVYIEWHPLADQHEKLVQLVCRVDDAIGSRAKLHSFLTSDLGAPLPLHISLSRPISLSTSNKDRFLDQISSALQASGVRQFSVNPRRLLWYNSPDSNRTFLVLQVASSSTPKSAGALSNPELMRLLNACNDMARRFDQPILYQNKGGEKDSADEAFHVSIGWALDLPVDEESIKALEAFGDEELQSLKTWEVPVPGVKVKIGNVVSHVPLSSGVPLTASRGQSRSLFGL
ncbi:U6 snRNA phosphodiesterase [Trichoderma ghanense]|uniref:U6 snRNA phosphodiesterase n=1 Tax=Trichoderma ghanense TaxID=65468 RepID=A0ABY2HGI6_9HYPO